ncbi:MAG: amino acid--tRNA ligase-related protein, partial [Pseudomonadales bacterium]
MTQWRPLASREHLLKRAGLLRQTREFFYQRDVVEVQTPLLGQGTVTDPDVESLVVPSVGYLQTSPEYFIKRLLAACMPSCYQLAGAFRAGEQGRLHNPEFTMLEWYRLDFDHQQLMAEVAQLVDALLGPGDYATRSYASLVADVNAPREQLDLEFATACAQTTGRVFIVD